MAAKEICFQEKYDTVLYSEPSVYSLKVAAFRNSYAHSAEKLAGEEMSAISLENVQPIPDILTIS